jgi:hypothetical protein
MAIRELTLDVVEIEEARKWCEDAGIEFHVVREVGPGGGNPLVRVRAEEEVLWILVSDWGYDHDDFPELHDLNPTFGFNNHFRRDV